jgi:hypothetical protein
MHDFEQCQLRAAADFFSVWDAFKNIFFGANNYKKWSTLC